MLTDRWAGPCAYKSRNEAAAENETSGSRAMCWSKPSDDTCGYDYDADDRSDDAGKRSDLEPLGPAATPDPGDDPGDECGPRAWLLSLRRVLTRELETCRPPVIYPQDS